ncbi:ECF transporter, substrate-specific component [Candidatus Nanopelagicaceae bacterium]
MTTQMKTQLKTKNIISFTAASAATLFLVSTVSLLGFLWPFFVTSDSSAPQWIFLACTPIALFLFFAKVSNGDLDAKSVALLALLSALIAAVRPLGTGAVGIEPMWFILILSARVFGPAFGFLLGALSMVLSAFITGGIGPWLAYQSFAAAWIGLGVALIPRSLRGRRELVALIIYGILAAQFFGTAMDLQFWPWYLGVDSQLSYIPGGAFAENIDRFFTYHFLSALAWDIPRAIFTSVLLAVAGKPVLGALRRAHTRARFVTPIEFRDALTISERAIEPSANQR